jgi:hypothetical protein
VKNVHILKRFIGKINGHSRQLEIGQIVEADDDQAGYWVSGGMAEFTDKPINTENVNPVKREKVKSLEKDGVLGIFPEEE